MRISSFFHPETLRNISPGFVAFFDRICYNFSNMTENQRWIIPAAPVAEGAGDGDIRYEISDISEGIPSGDVF